MTIIVIEESVQKSELAEHANKQFPTYKLVKAVVDIERKIMAIGGGMHSDEEIILLQSGSKQGNLWGINIYPFNEEDFIEYDSMINLRPSQGNYSRGVDNPKIRDEIAKIVKKLVKE